MIKVSASISVYHAKVTRIFLPHNPDDIYPGKYHHSNLPKVATWRSMAVSRFTKPSKLSSPHKAEGKAHFSI